MSGNFQFSGSNMPASREGAEQVIVEAGGLHYGQLNERIARLAEEGARRLLVTGVRGQRYLGARLAYDDLHLLVEGVPGEDLGFNLNGPTLEIRGPVQNAAANTMDSGKIIVHGLGGDALAYGMRGGKLFVRDDVGYRVGIHMKQYRDKVPVVVIGGTSGDYLGEYMSGGIIVLLNRNGAAEMVAGAAGKTLAAGMHGGEIYIFDYALPDHLPGIGACPVEAGGDDRSKIEPLVREFCVYFDLDPAGLMERELVKVVPTGSRPFARFYFPSYPVDTGLMPVQAERVSPCEASCPAGVPTGHFLRHLRKGEVKKAMELIDRVTPLRYSCCGFICPHLCMQSCTRGRLDFSIRTAELARNFKSELLPEKEGDYPEKIAVIGAGPAGLSTAYQLTLKGYRVTVYDEAERPGGKMFQVISRARLPLEELEHDMDRIRKLGVEFKPNRRVDGKLFSRLLKQYDHVVVAVGAQQPVIPPVKGAGRIRAGIEFLKSFNRGETVETESGPGPEDRIVVVGGGDAAVDGIEAAMALGAKPSHITVIDLKIPSADIRERKKLEREGVSFRYPLLLKEVTDGGVVVHRPEGKEEFIPASMVLAFINEKPALDFLPAGLQQELDERGFFGQRGGDCSCRTGDSRVSVVGDSRGLALVTTNIGRGRRCAAEVHAFLRGEQYLPGAEEELEEARRHPERAVPVAPEEADLEVEFERCLHCGICVQCDSCIEACPRHALSREGELLKVDLALCGGCGTCAATCPGGVIRMERRA